MKVYFILHTKLVKSNDTFFRLETDVIPRKGECVSVKGYMYHVLLVDHRLEEESVVITLSDI